MILRALLIQNHKLYFVKFPYPLILFIDIMNICHIMEGIKSSLINYVSITSILRHSYSKL